jgi:hypothetical protein
LLLLACPALVGICAMMLGDAWSEKGLRRPAVERAVHGAIWTLASQGLFVLCPFHVSVETLFIGLGLALFVSGAIGWISPSGMPIPLVWENRVIRMTEIAVSMILIGAAAAWVAPFALRRTFI